MQPQEGKEEELIDYSLGTLFGCELTLRGDEYSYEKARKYLEDQHAKRFVEYPPEMIHALLNKKLSSLHKAFLLNNMTTTLQNGEWRATRKGTDVSTYGAVHYWLKKNYGTPRICENKDCDGETDKRWFDWALKHGYDYEKKRENFFRLCRSCHKRYDLTEKMKEQAISNLWWLGKKGIRKLTEKEVLEIREKSANGARQRDLVKEYDVDKKSIYMIKRNKTWRHI